MAVATIRIITMTLFWRRLDADNMPFTSLQQEREVMSGDGVPVSATSNVGSHPGGQGLCKGVGL